MPEEKLGYPSKNIFLSICSIFLVLIGMIIQAALSYGTVSAKVEGLEKITLKFEQDKADLQERQAETDTEIATLNSQYENICADIKEIKEDVRAIRDRVEK